MKIYNKLVISFESGEIVEEDSFEYSGPVARCFGGGGSPDPPPPVEPTPAETALTKSQTALVNAQIEQIPIQNAFMQQQLGMQSEYNTAAMAAMASAEARNAAAYAEAQKRAKEYEPFQLESMGYYRNEQGKITKLPGVAALQNKQYAMQGLSPTGEKLTEEQMLGYMTDAEKADYELAKLYRQRQKDALEGKLPISPALESELAEEERQTTEMLSRKLGPDWQLSTPGQKAMTALRQKADLVREEARRGQISSGEGVLTLRENQENTRRNYLSDVMDQSSNLRNQELARMQGYINSAYPPGYGSGGYGGLIGSGSGVSGNIYGNALESSMQLSNKLGADRANQQNYNYSVWANQVNNQNARAASRNQTASSVVTAAAAAAAAV